MVAPEVVETRRYVPDRLPVLRAEQPLAEAVTAEACALVRYEQERGVRILVLQSGQWCVARLIGGIERAEVLELTRVGNDKAANRVVGVVPVDELQVVVVRPKREAVRDRLELWLARSMSGGRVHGYR